jgi:hypothetical protein
MFIKDILNIYTQLLIFLNLIVITNTPHDV